MLPMIIHRCDINTSAIPLYTGVIMHMDLRSLTGDKGQDVFKYIFWYYLFLRITCHVCYMYALCSLNFSMYMNQIFIIYTWHYYTLYICVVPTIEKIQTALTLSNK